MSYTYTPSNAVESKKLDRSSVSLQATYILNKIIGLFVSTFLVSYITQVNREAPISVSLTSIGLFFVMHNIIFALIYFLMSYLVDRSNRIWFYRLGLLCKGAFIILIVFLGQSLAKMSIVAGIVNGISDGVYWSSYNVLKGEMVPRAHADKFVAISSLFDRVSRVVFSVLLGYLIDVSTFIEVSLYVLIIVALQIIFSFFIKAKRPENSKFEFFKYIKYLKTNDEKTKRIKRFYHLALAYAGTSICTSIASIFAVLTFKTNLYLGIFTSAFSIISVLTLLVLKRYTKIGRRKVWFMCIAIIGFTASCLSLFGVFKWTYIVYYLVETVSVCLIEYTVDVQRTVIVKKTGNYEYTCEHQALTEMCLSVVRALCYSLMIVLGLTLEILGFKILMAIIGLFFPLQAYLVYKMEKVEKDYALNGDYVPQNCLNKTETVEQ